MIKYICDKCQKEVDGFSKENERYLPEEGVLREVRFITQSSLQLCLGCRELKQNIEGELVKKQKLEQENLEKEFINK